MDKTEKGLHEIVDIFNSVSNGEEQFKLLNMVISNYIQFMNDRNVGEIEYLLFEIVDCTSSYFRDVRSFDEEKFLDYIQKGFHDKNNH